MVRAECGVAPIFSTKSRTSTEQKQSRIRKVATLARSSERGRALAAPRNAPPVSVTQQIVQQSKSLYSTDLDPAAPAQTPVSNIFLSCPKSPSLFLPHFDKSQLSEPGPLGMRAEHWYEFGEHSEESNMFVQVVAHIAAAVFPHSLLQYVRSGLVDTDRSS